MNRKEPNPSIINGGRKTGLNNVQSGRNTSILKTQTPVKIVRPAPPPAPPAPKK
jgi:hypothetical protein